jgi:hypothetical protein
MIMSGRSSGQIGLAPAYPVGDPAQLDEGPMSALSHLRKYLAMIDLGQWQTLDTCRRSKTEIEGAKLKNC